MGNLIFRGSYHYNAPLHSKLHLSSTKPLIWAIAMSNAAIGRNMGYPMVNLPYLGGGSGTKKAAPTVISRVERSRPMGTR